jgi:Skp family chaperone for outer membrane proteins
MRNDLQQAEQRVVAFQAGQVSRAYVEVATAAKKVAGEMGYSHVVASRPVAAEFRGQNVESVVQEVLQRVLVVGPEGQDITENVLKELKIEAPKPAIAVPVVEEGPKPAPTK